MNAVNLRRCLVAKGRCTILDIRMPTTTTPRVPLMSRPEIVSNTTNTTSNIEPFGKGGWLRVTASPMDDELLTMMTRHNSHGFHSSATSMLPVRRRRRKGATRKIETDESSPSEESDDGTTTLQRMHAPVTNPLEFSQASLGLLEKIERAVEPMKAYNETFVTKRSRGEIGEMFTIDLGPKAGLYQIETSVDEQVFEYTSPISGKLLYCLSSTTGEWVNMDDGHRFEGIFVRDLLRSNCIGLPDL
mmetsp:Transcript_27644/g.60868  ORF Transcript_27644/g.60868 Transcript_27644/m.60868 type:complete len:245 (-) Transcript_27644:13-747(-)